MDIGTALRLKLQDDAAVTAQFGARLYPLRLPQAPVFPAATYQLISALPNYSHDGSSNLTAGRLQFDIYAESYEALGVAAAALKDSLDAWKGTIGDPQGLDIGGVFWVNEMDWPVPDTERSGPVLYRKTLECTPWFSKR